jgi:hypothetical protein
VKRGEARVQIKYLGPNTTQGDLVRSNTQPDATIKLFTVASLSYRPVSFKNILFTLINF